MKVRLRLIWLVAACLVVPALARAQDAGTERLAGTLKKVADSGTLVLGYRESSIPFSFLNAVQQPVGYSVDLCREIADDVAAELGRESVTISLLPVTAENRIDKVSSGAVDLECGSTTNNTQRQKQVAFSPIIFIAGTKLLVPAASAIRSYRDLSGKTVVVTAGTTNDAAIRKLAEKQRLDIKIVTSPDHAQSMAMVANGKADAFATDDVLLAGFVATARDPGAFKVVGELLSFEPYGLMFRRDDPQFAAVVQRSFERMAITGRLAELYTRWFLKRLPDGDRMNMPMSPQLEAIFGALGAPD